MTPACRNVLPVERLRRGGIVEHEAFVSGVPYPQAIGQVVDLQPSFFCQSAKNAPGGLRIGPSRQMQTVAGPDQDRGAVARRFDNIRVGFQMLQPQLDRTAIRQGARCGGRKRLLHHRGRDQAWQIWPIGDAMPSSSVLRSVRGPVTTKPCDASIAARKGSPIVNNPGTKVRA